MGKREGGVEDGAILNDRDLRVWQASIDLAKVVYRLTQPFPQREVYGFASQRRRAAVSIPSNIAEGHPREGTKEYRLMSVI